MSDINDNDESADIQKKKSAISELKLKIEKLEKMSEKRKFELIRDTKTSDYLSNTRFGKYKLYHYFLFLKIYTNHMHDQEFASSRKSMLVALGLPILTTVGFAIVNPFSIFKNITWIGVTFGSVGNFIYTVKDDLIELARTDCPTGFEVREHFKNLSLIDPFFPTFKEYTMRTLRRKEKQEPEITDWTEFYMKDDDE